MSNISRAAFFFKKAIERNPDRDLSETIFSAGNAPDCSEINLTREFRRLFGMEPKSFQELCKIIHSGHLVQDWLFHATGKSTANILATTGFRVGSCWGTLPVAAYYACQAAEEGNDWAICAIKKSDLDPHLCKPDLPSLREPLTTVLHKTEDSITNKWRRSSKDWTACLDIVGSVHYDGEIEARNVALVQGLDDLNKLISPPEPERTP